MKESDIHLGERLHLCASFVREGTRLCDVGTDHAYLPIWLALHNRIISALACDVREGPLSTAKSNISRFHLQKLITPRLSDGLCAVQSQEVEDIVIAGMGGDLIARIVTETPWLYHPEKLLILQPMTKPSHLRAAMAGRGFTLLQEEAVYDEHRVYTVMKYRYLPRECKETDSVQIYTGALTGKNAAEREYLLRQSHYLQQKLFGLLRGGDSPQTKVLVDALQKIEDMCL